MQQLNIKKSFLFSALKVFLLASTSLYSHSADAACATIGMTTICDAAAPNPATTRIGNGPSEPVQRIVEIMPGAILSTGDDTAIAVSDHAEIRLHNGVTVENFATTILGGAYDGGRNTIDLGSNNGLVLGIGAKVLARGPSTTAEAINMFGTGNVIMSTGHIESSSGAAFYIHSNNSGRNYIFNSVGGLIRGGNGFAFGQTGNSSLLFENAGRVEGNMIFGGGDDILRLDTSSTIIGTVSGGGGVDKVILYGVGNATTADTFAQFEILEKIQSGTWTMTGSLSSGMQVTVDKGVLVLTGNNPNSANNFTVNTAGTLEGGTQSLTRDIANSGLVRFAQFNNGTYAHVISGSGAVEKTQAGTLFLTQTNTYTGGTAINDGTISITTDANLGAAAGGLFFDGGTLATTADITTARDTILAAQGGSFATNAATKLSITSVIAGAGSLSKAGDGTLVLSGANTYTGGTVVEAGTLFIDGDQSAATGLMTVNNGAILRDVGTLGGDVMIADGATLAPGGSTPGTLTMNGNLSLSSGALLNYRFGQAGVPGGPLNDMINVAGDLTLDGTLNVTVPAGGSYGPGVYRIFNYDGALIDNGLALGTIPASKNYLQTSVVNQVNLVNPAGLTLSHWDGSAGPKDNDVVNGGDGLWQNAAGNEHWTDSAGTFNAPYKDATFAIFQGAAGRVTVDNSFGNVLSGGMQFATDGYHVQGDTITLVGTTADPTQTIFRIGHGGSSGAGITTAISAELTGASQLVKTDLGTLVLTGDNTYTGGTIVEAGTLSISNDVNLGEASGRLLFRGGALRTTADLRIARDTTLEGDATFLTDADTEFTHAGMIHGSGGFTKAGAGTLILDGTSSYSGVTSIADGTLRAGHAGAVSTTSAFVVQHGAEFDLNGFSQKVASLDNAGSVRLGSQPNTVLEVTGNYIGNDGLVQLSGVLGDDASPTAQLRIGGDSSGSSLLRFENVGGQGALTVEGIKVIDIAGTSNGNFVLQGDYTFQGSQAVVGGAYAYRLYKNGISTPADGDWYLRSSLIIPAEPVKPLYQAGAPLYESYANILLEAFGTLPTLRERVGSRYAQNALGRGAGAIVLASDTLNNGVWSRVEGMYANLKPATSSTLADYRINRGLLEFGADGVFQESTAGVLIGGILAKFGKSNAKVSSVFGSGTIDSYGYGIGATLTWYGNNNIYVDGQAHLTWTNSDLRSNLVDDDLIRDNIGFGFSTGVEVGHHLYLTPQWTVTPQVQLTYTHFGFDDFRDVFGASISTGGTDRLQGRLGASIDYEKFWRVGAEDVRMLKLYGISNLYYDVLDDSKVNVSGVTLESKIERLRVGIGLGGTYSWANSKYSIYGETKFDTNVRNLHNNHRFEGRIGLKVSF